MDSQSRPFSSADAAFSMEDFAKALDQYDYQFSRGQVVSGKVVNYDSDGVYVDIGAKAAAFLPKAEASLSNVSDLSGLLPLNEERQFLIIRDQDADGQVTLSLRQLEIRRRWEEMAELQDSNQSFQVRVMAVNKGGVTVDAKGLRGFVPRSHLVEREDLEALKGTTLTVSVLEIDRSRNRLVLSNRLATRSASFSQLEVGQLVEGKVTGIKTFGVFVEFNGTTGLLHINQISKNYVDNLTNLFQIGQPIKALILALDEGKGRVSLSTKVLENYPGEMLENMTQVMAEAEERQTRARQALLAT